MNTHRVFKDVQVMQRVQWRWEPAYRVITDQVTPDGRHIWPFDPDFPVDVRPFECGGQNTPMNRHDYFELAYVYDGQCELRLDDGRNEAGTGDLLVIGPQMAHHIYVAPPRRAKVATLYFKPEIIAGSCAGAEVVKYLMPFVHARELAHTVPQGTGLPGEIFDLMRRMGSRLDNRDGESRLVVMSFLKLILALLADHYGGRAGARPTIEPRQTEVVRLQPVFDMVSGAFDQPIVVRQAARAAAMSVSAFAAFFKRATGQTFHAYLHRFRIAKAQELLITTDATLSDISQRTGYCDQSHFGLVFRKLTGVTPQGFRQQNGRAPRG